MLMRIINQPMVRNFIDSLPEYSPLVKAARVGAKSLLFRRRIYTGVRALWAGVEDTVLEKYYLLGPGPDEVLVQTEYSAVSPGTERRYYENADDFHIEYPYVPGYSASGVVVAMGKSVTEFQRGDRVAGVMKHASMNLIPQASLSRVPEGVGADLASLVTLGVIAMAGLRRTAVKPGERVAVIGQGMIGQLILALVRASGAGSVIAVARTDKKKELSLATGADEFIAAADEPERLKGLEADIVVEASGFPAALGTAFDLCRRGGRVILAGSSSEEYGGQDIKKKLIEKEVSLIGAHVRNIPSGVEAMGSYRREAEAFLDLLKAGRLSVRHLIPRPLKPAELPGFYRELSRGETETVSVVVDWRGKGMLFGKEEEEQAKTSSAMPLFSCGKRGTVRFALVGCGAITKANAAALRAVPGAEIAVAMDVSEEAARRFARDYGGSFTSDMDTVLSDGSVDIVLIAVPHHLHCELTLRTAAAGKHVVVEKPIAMNVDEARRMIEACRSNGVGLSVCYPMRYSPAVRKARRFIRDGGLGELFGTQIIMLRDKSESFLKRDTWYEGNPDWRAKRAKSGGGIFMDNIAHYLDYYHYLTGLDVVEVVGVQETRLLPADVEDTAGILYRYANGAQGIVTVSSVTRGGGTEINPSISNTIQNLWGADGQVILYPALKLFSRRRAAGLTPGRWHTSRLKPAAGVRERTRFFERVVRSLLEDRSFEITGEEGLKSLAVIQASYESGKLNRWVTVEEA